MSDDTKSSRTPILLAVVGLAVLAAVFFFVIRPLVFGTTEEALPPVAPGAQPSPSASASEAPERPEFPTHAERDPFAPVPGLPVR